MDPTYDHLGLPAGNFSVQPPLPAGLTLNARSGKMAGTPIRDTPRGDYIVTLANPSGKTDITLSLEVQKHVKPSVEFSFPPYLFVGQSITPVEPKIADDGNRLMFSVSPPLPEGLMMDAWSGVVSGTPPDAIGKIECTVTARNRRGEQRTKISFEIHGAPSSITYTGVPGPNEFADPPHASGLLLVDDLVSLKPSSGTPEVVVGLFCFYIRPLSFYTSIEESLLTLVRTSGLPSGTWSVQPALPAGLTLDKEMGHIDGKPLHVMPRSDYTLTLENPLGKSNLTLSLEVQKHIPCVCVCVSVCVHMYTYIYKYIFTFTYTYIHIFRCRSTYHRCLWSMPHLYSPTKCCARSAWWPRTWTQSSP
jgi:hypothetical protein